MSAKENESFIIQAQPTTEDTNGTSTERSRNALLPIFLIAAVLDTGFGSIFALLAEIQNQLNITIAEIGLIGGAGFISSFFAQIALSRFADRGYARAMIRIGLLCAAISMFSLIWADSLLEFAIGRLFFGLSEGLFVPAARRVAIAWNPRLAGELLGRLAAFQMFGFLIGPLFGSLIFQWFGLRAVFVATFALIATCSLLVIRVPVPEAAAATGEPRVLRALMGKRSIQAMMVIAVGYYGSFGIYEAIWAIHLSELGASQFMVSITFTLFALPMILLAPLAGRIAPRWGPTRLTFLGIAVSIPPVVLYGVWESIPLLIVVMIVHAVADAFVLIAFQLAIARQSGNELASGQGLVNAVGLAVAAGSALASGFVYEHFGPIALFGGWGLVMAVSLAIGFQLGKKEFYAEFARR